jgi:hypothetical protein
VYQGSAGWETSMHSKRAGIVSKKEMARWRAGVLAAAVLLVGGAGLFLLPGWAGVREPRAVQPVQLAGRRVAAEGPAPATPPPPAATPAPAAAATLPPSPSPRRPRVACAPLDVTPADRWGAPALWIWQGVVAWAQSLRATGTAPLGGPIDLVVMTLDPNTTLVPGTAELYAQLGLLVRRGLSRGAGWVGGRGVAARPARVA